MTHWFLEEGFRWVFKHPLATIIVVDGRYLIQTQNYLGSWVKCRDDADAKVLSQYAMMDLIKDLSNSL
jgi:hypothetical protein